MPPLLSPSRSHFPSLALYLAYRTRLESLRAGDANPLRGAPACAIAPAAHATLNVHALGPRDMQQGACVGHRGRAVVVGHRTSRPPKGNLGDSETRLGIARAPAQRALRVAPTTGRTPCAAHGNPMAEIPADPTLPRSDADSEQKSKGGCWIQLETAAVGDSDELVKAHRRRRRRAGLRGDSARVGLRHTQDLINC
jgi:hypothetical protein